jgi:hypothetical protein
MVPITTGDGALRLAAGVVFFFICQFGARVLMSAVSGKFRALTKEQKDDWVVRFCSCVNGVLCFRSAYYLIFLSWDIPKSDLFASMPGAASAGPFPMGVSSTDVLTAFAADPMSALISGPQWLFGGGYRECKYLIVSYFIWDCIVCFAYNWNVAFKIHGILSMCGTYSLLLPCGDRYSAWFCGMFELGNSLLHSTEMLKTLDMAPGLREALMAVFALSFIGIRLIGGTIYSYDFVAAAYTTLQQAGPNAVSGPVTGVLVLMGIIVWGLQMLQYIWGKQVILGVLSAVGLYTPSTAADEKASESEKKKVQ